MNAPDDAPPQSSGYARPPWRYRIVDPRTLALYVVVLNVLLMGRGTMTLLLASLAVVAVGLVLTVRRKAFISWAVFVAVCLVCLYVLPVVWHSAVSAFLGFVAFWMFRFAGIAGAFMGAYGALDIQRLGAVLTQMHAPRVVFVPLMVVVRFFPMAVRELRAIVQAMTLRGLRPGFVSGIAHPLRTGEYVVIPFLASAARTADELSAAAIIKGLGSPGARSASAPSRFGWGDLVLLALVLGLVVLRVSGVGA